MGNIAKYISEKFSDDSDPVKDMGIGTPALIKSINWSISKRYIEDRLKEKKYEFIQNYKGYSILVYLTEHNYFEVLTNCLYKPSGKIAYQPLSISFITSNKDDAIKKIKYKIDKIKDKILNEIFTDESDPIHDLGIGKPRWEDAAAGDVIRVKKYISQSHPTNTYMILNQIFRNHDGDITSVTYYSCDDVKDLKKSLKQLNKLSYHQWSLDKEFIEDHLELVPKWEIDNLKESVNEKFSDESDPITDMGIGILSKLKHGTWLRCKKRIPIKVTGTIDFHIERGYYTVIKTAKLFKKLIKFELGTYEKFPKHFTKFDLKYVGGEFLVITYDKFFEHFEIIDKGINEKFEADSDPIRDMGIGDLSVVIKQRIQELSHADAEDKAMFSYWYSTRSDKGLPGNFCITLTSTIGHEKKEKVLKYCEKRIKEAELEEFLDSHAKIIADHQVYWDIKSQYTKCFIAAENDTVNEKFSEEGDPIHDMGIGLRALHNFKSEDELNMFVAEMLPGILRINKLPENILNDEGSNYYLIFSENLSYKLNKIAKYVREYLTVNGQFQSVNYEKIHIALKKLYPKLTSWLVDDEGHIINEKFSEEAGDPVRDMGIGGIERLKKILYSIPSGSCWSLYELYFKKYCDKTYESYSVYLVRIMYHTIKIIIEHQELTPQESFEQTVKYEMDHKKKKKYLPKKHERLKILKKVAELLSIKFNVEVDPYFENNKVNEKFSEEGDALKDMGIGQQYYKNKLIDLIPKDIQTNKNYNAYPYDVRKFFMYVINDDATTVDINDSGKLITVTCKEYSKKQFFGLLEEVLKSCKGIFMAHVKGDVMSIALDNSVNEKFSDTSDPIIDMGIGSIKAWKEAYHKLFNLPPVKTYNKYFEGDPENPNAYCSGKIYWLMDTLKYLIKGDTPHIAFEKAGKESGAYNESYYWMTKIKKEVAAALKKHFDININVNESVNEKFSDTSDPIIDMGIGNMYETIPLYVKVTELSPNIIGKMEGKDATEFLKKKGIEYTIKKLYQSGIGCIKFKGPKKSLDELLNAFFEIKTESYDTYMHKMK